MKPGSTASITDAPPPALADGRGHPSPKLPAACADGRGRPRGESTSPVGGPRSPSSRPRRRARCSRSARRDSSSASGSSASSWEASSAARHEVPGHGRDALAEVVGGHDELHERRVGARGADRVAVGAAQRRAGDDHGRRPPRRAPRPTSRSHGHRSSSSSGTPARIFATFAARVQVVGVDERRCRGSAGGEPIGERGADDRLARTARSHHDEARRTATLMRAG